MGSEICSPQTASPQMSVGPILFSPHEAAAVAKVAEERVAKKAKAAALPAAAS